MFFAGDSAHIHLPLAGQGLNTGLGDAVNLGWKLAEAVRGWAPGGLLDTYHAERHPVGALVLANTQTQGLLMDWAGTANPDLAVARGLLGELLEVPEAMRWLSGMMTGLDIRYDLGGEPTDPFVGVRMPDLDVTVDGERRSGRSLLHAGRGLLLDLGGTERLSGLRGWTDRVDHVRVPEDLPAMLIRPDGYVCWTSRSGPLEPALRSWFGVPDGDLGPHSTSTRGQAA